VPGTCLRPAPLGARRQVLGFLNLGEFFSHRDQLCLKGHVVPHLHAEHGVEGLQVGRIRHIELPEQFPERIRLTDEFHGRLLDRIYVKGQAKRLVATDGSPAQFLTA
jgi:hypothetical protein